MSAVDGKAVDAAVGAMVAALAQCEEADWQVRAGSLEWSCWETAAHVAHDLAAYAGQVAGRATAAYLPCDLVTRPTTPPRELLTVIRACGGLLSSAVARSEAGPIAWHWGMCDAAGFAAMGTAEVLVHTFDITQGLDVAWLPPDSLSEGVVSRLLPDLPPGPPAQTLLWATGRAPFEGRPAVTDWVWRAAQ